MDTIAKDPTQHTVEANQKALQQPDFPDDTHDYDSARRGFLATLDQNGQATGNRLYVAKIGTPEV